jgi:hypothetical protein
MAPFAGALLLVACTGGNDPVADNAVAPPDGLVGDASATGLAAPANSAAAEAVRQAALPVADGGLSWTLSEADHVALFGPPQGEPAISIQCLTAGNKKRLAFTRNLAAPVGATGTLSFTGNGVAASLPAMRDGTQGIWRADVPSGDMARDVASTFDGQGAVNVTVGGTPPLVIPASPAARAIFAECLGT